MASPLFFSDFVVHEPSFAPDLARKLSQLTVLWMVLIAVQIFPVEEFTAQNDIETIAARPFFRRSYYMTERIRRQALHWGRVIQEKVCLMTAILLSNPHAGRQSQRTMKSPPGSPLTKGGGGDYHTILNKSFFSKVCKKSGVVYQKRLCVFYKGGDIYVW